ncbi:MAG: hypothetical protein AB7H90_13015 [Alphaproteobacteria bacterium]
MATRQNTPVPTDTDHFVWPSTGERLPETPEGAALVVGVIIANDPGLKRRVSNQPVALFMNISGRGCSDFGGQRLPPNRDGTGKRRGGHENDRAPISARRAAKTRRETPGGFAVKCRPFCLRSAGACG